MRGWKRADRDVEWVFLSCVARLSVFSDYSSFPRGRGGSYPVLPAIVYNPMVSCAATPAVNSSLSVSSPSRSASPFVAGSRRKCKLRRSSKPPAIRRVWLCILKLSRRMQVNGRSFQFTRMARHFTNCVQDYGTTLAGARKDLAAVPRITTLLSAPSAESFPPRVECAPRREIRMSNVCDRRGAGCADSPCHEKRWISRSSDVQQSRFALAIHPAFAAFIYSPFDARETKRSEDA